MYQEVGVTVLNNAHDIFNLSRSFAAMEENFAALRQTYVKIGLALNEK
jgi:hypothetical protein